MNQKQKPYLLWRILRFYVFYSDEIFQRFRHFQTINMKMSGVPKVIHPIVASIVSFWLCYFIVMMRKFQITSSRMNINWEFSENFMSHCWALNVPSWSPKSPFWLPKGLIFFRFLPQCKILFVFLFGTLSRKHSFSFFQLFLITKRCRLKLGISMTFTLRILYNIEVHRTIGFISEAFLNYLFDEVNDLRDILWNSGNHIR